MENINQMPNLQPIEPISPVKNKNLFKYLFIASVVILLVVIIAFYFVLNNKINQLSNKQTAEITPTQITETNIEVVPTTIPTIASTESTLIEDDSNHNLFTNNKIGFSLIMPKTVQQASCLKESNSYSLNENKKTEETPLTFFEKGDILYLAVNYFYKLTGEQKIYQGQGYTSNFSGCKKNETTFDKINNERKTNFNPVNLKIYTANIKNDNELENYIKSKYGIGCKLGEKTLSSNGTYSVKILSDGKGLDESQCPINFAIDTKYNPTKGKLIIFELGQSCSLYKDFINNDCYTEEIVNSLKFI